MPFRITGLHLPIDGDERELEGIAARWAGVPHEAIASMEIVRRSLDRRRGGLSFIYTVDLHLHDERPPSQAPRMSRVSWRPKARLKPDKAGDEPLALPPVVIGTGPAGLFAALHLARCGFRPIVLERGDRMNIRTQRIRELNVLGTLDPESNYLYGEGGAGTFSDGKLTSRSKDPRAAFVLEECREKSGVASVAFDYRPHLGSDRIRAVVGRIRQEILALGGDIRFRCRFLDFVISAGTIRALRTTWGEMPANVVILAPGHSARDLYRALDRQGIPLEPKPFQMGFRVEHPQEFVDQAVWGRFAGNPKLGPADYRLAVHAGGTTVYSFCMCPGGEIIPAVSDLEHMNTNGMSWSKRASGFANSGIVTTLEPEHFEGGGALAGIALQERFEKMGARLVGGSLAVPGQRLIDYLEDRTPTGLPSTSCRTGAVPARIREVVPPLLDRVLRDGLRIMEGQMRGFLHSEAVLVGPESRSSSPVRIVRVRETLASPAVDALFPIGEGAGYAGGIVSAAVDGLRAAQKVVQRFRPPGMRLES